MKRHKTSYPGVYYRKARRLGGPGNERVYYIVFKKGGKVFEKKVGRQFEDGMTPARAAKIRGERKKHGSMVSLMEKMKTVAHGPHAELMEKFIDFLNEPQTEKPT